MCSSRSLSRENIRIVDLTLPQQDKRPIRKPQQWPHCLIFAYWYDPCSALLFSGFSGPAACVQRKPALLEAVSTAQECAPMGLTSVR